MHISPSAKASRVGLPAKSSVLSSKLVAGWIISTTTSFHSKKELLLPVELLSSFPAILLHPVTLKRQFGWFGFSWGQINNQTKLISLLLTLGSVSLCVTALGCAVYICTGFHRCGTFQLCHHGAFSPQNFTLSFHFPFWQSITAKINCTKMFPIMQITLDITWKYVSRKTPVSSNTYGGKG